MIRAVRGNLQARRRWFQAGFFVLFVLAPPLDIFRLDLTLSTPFRAVRWVPGRRPFACC